MSDFLAVLARSTAARAVQIDYVLSKLIVTGAELGALEPSAAIGIDGDWREIKLPPRIWLDRICKAVEVGAFDRLPLDDIVERILLPPLPAE